MLTKGIKHCHQNNSKFGISIDPIVKISFIHRFFKPSLINNRNSIIPGFIMFTRTGFAAVASKPGLGINTPALRIVEQRDLISSFSKVIKA